MRLIDVLVAAGCLFVLATWIKSLQYDDSASFPLMIIGALVGGAIAGVKEAVIALLIVVCALMWVAWYMPVDKDESGVDK